MIPVNCSIVRPASDALRTIVVKLPLKLAPTLAAPWKFFKSRSAFDATAPNMPLMTPADCPSTSKALLIPGIPVLANA